MTFDLSMDRIVCTLVSSMELWDLGGLTRLEKRAHPATIAKLNSSTISQTNEAN